MAWMYQRPGSANWWIGYRVGGKQFLKTTGTADKKEAQKQLDKMDTLSTAKRTGMLTEEFFHALMGTTVERVSLKAGLDEWLNARKGTTAPRTYERYENAVRQFTEYFNATDTAPLLRDVGVAEMRAFLASLHAHRSAGTVNLARKILSVFFNDAMVRGHITANPVKGTKRYKATKAERKKRRAFTVEEVRTTLKAVPNPFWRYMVVGGMYSGLRLGDLISLRHSEFDAANNQLVLESGKVGNTLHIPIAAPLLAEIKARLATKKNWKPSDFLWPEQAAKYAARGSGPFGKEFYEQVLVPAGLAEKRSHAKRDRSDAEHGRRDVNELSFHSLRHSFISMLKVSGASQSVAKELAGHTSDAVNDLYTHTSIEVLAHAIKQLPEVTK